MSLPRFLVDCLSLRAKSDIVGATAMDCLAEAMDCLAEAMDCLALTITKVAPTLARRAAMDRWYGDYCNELES